MWMSIIFCKQKPAYEVRISDWSSDVCSSDLPPTRRRSSPTDHASPPASTALSRLVPEGSDQLGQRGAGAGACVAEDGGGGYRAEVAAGLETGRASCRERVRQYV